LIKFCGGGGIRTPDTLRYAGFQDQCNQPGSATPPKTIFISTNLNEVKVIITTQQNKILIS
tara:strand:- start:190 stop:372 length:183 start_codon:yes stop_codon:yes gene_type:complete